jgi:hypothetical protein
LQAGDLGRAQTAFTALSGGHNNTSVSTPAAVVNLASTQPSTATQTTTTGTASIYQQLQAFRQQRAADLAQLGQDLQGGNLTAAQQDFNTLTALGQTGPGNKGQPFQQTGRAQDFQAIGQALQNGDLAGAQTAYTALASTFGSQNQQAQNAISAYNSGVTEIIINLVSPPVATGTVPPISVPPSVRVTSPPVFKGQPVGPVAHPVLAGTLSPGTGPNGVPEIVINLGATSGTTASGGSTPPELVINLDQANNSSSGASGTSEIVINLGATSSTAASSTTSSTGSTTPEIVNLGQGNGSSTAPAEELTINLGSGSSGAQIIIEGAQGKNGNSTEPVTINLNPQNNYELILNLLNSSSTNSSNGLSVSA